MCVCGFGLLFWFVVSINSYKKCFLYEYMNGLMVLLDKIDLETNEYIMIELT